MENLKIRAASKLNSLSQFCGCSAQQVLHWLAPPSCILCSQPVPIGAEPVCDACYTDFPAAKHACGVCGQYYAGNTSSCGRCLKSPPYYDACIYPLDYSGSVRQLITDYKFTPRPQLAPLLAKLVLEAVFDSDTPLPEAIIAAPMHKKRLRERGFDHTLALAMKVAKQLDIPLLSKVIVKSVNTDPQSSLAKRQRASNLKNTYQCPRILTISSVAVIDDVLTTGATMNEIAKTLKKNGVDYCQAWCLAHTP